MSYRENYEKWLHSPALSAAEKAELESIQGDEKEIESRFFDQLSFGTAGLRGTMGVGLYRMNVHVVRHATQAFAQVIRRPGRGCMLRLPEQLGRLCPGGRLRHGRQRYPRPPV